MTDKIPEEGITQVEATKEKRDVVQELSNLEGRVVKVTQKVLRETKALNPDLDFSHQNLDDLFSLTQEFFGASKTVTDYLQKEANTVSDELASVEGFAGTVGLGYPFYALDSEGKPIEVPEISSFISLTRNLVQEDMRHNPEGWACPACQAKNQLPDLKTFCKPCDLVKLKPRDVFKALPDVDIVVIVDSPSSETERQVEEAVKRLGYQQSDVNISEGIQRTKETLASLKKGEEPKEKVPVDVHIWDKDEVFQCLDLVAKGETNTTILSRSLHSTWEDNALNFWLDFVLSYTELDTRDKTLTKKVQETRSALKKLYGADKIVEMVASTSPRTARLLAPDSVKDILRKRVESW